MKKTVLLFFLTVILISCEKDRVFIVENTGIPLLSQVLISGETFLLYSYNEANLVVEEKSKFHYTKHNYSDNNLLSSSEFYMDPAMFSSSSSVIEDAMKRKEWVSPDNTAKSLTQTFEYNENGKLTRKIYTRPTVSNSEYSEFDIENDRISRQTMYWQNAISGYIDYVYNEKGNLEKETKYLILSDGRTELMTTTEYEYDNMRNPYIAFKRLMTPGKYTNPNNIVKTIYTLHFEVDAWIEKIQVSENKYEYNRLGYPVKVNDEVTYVYK